MLKEARRSKYALAAATATAVGTALFLLNSTEQAGASNNPSKISPISPVDESLVTAPFLQVSLDIVSQKKEVGPNCLYPVSIISNSNGRPVSEMSLRVTSDQSADFDKRFTSANWLWFPNQTNDAGQRFFSVVGQNSENPQILTQDFNAGKSIVKFGGNISGTVNLKFETGTLKDANGQVIQNVTLIDFVVPVNPDIACDPVTGATPTPRSATSTPTPESATNTPTIEAPTSTPTLQAATATPTAKATVITTPEGYKVFIPAVLNK